MALRTIQTTLAGALLLGASASCVSAAHNTTDDGYVTVRMPGGRTIRVKESVVEGRSGSGAQRANRSRSGGKTPSSGGSGGHLSSGSGSGGSGDGSGGGDTNSDDAYPANASTPVRVFAWERSISGPFQNMTQTIVVDPNAGGPVAVANWTAAKIQAGDPDHIALRLWKELEPALRDPFDMTDPVELFEVGGYTDGLSEYWGAFATQLRSRGYTPDYIVQDLEKGVGFWHIDEDDRPVHFGQIFAARDRLNGHVPQQIFQTDVDGFLDYRSASGRIPRRWYALLSLNLRRDIIQRGIQQPMNAGFGQEIPFSNYKDLLPSFDVYWYTGGGTHLPVSVAGISAPESYLYDRGRAGRYSGRAKHQRWNTMIDVLNRVRSCAASGPVHPWIAPPGYGRGQGSNLWARSSDLPGEQLLWEALVTHMLAMGVDTFLLWNPGTRFNPNAVGSDQFMDAWFAGKAANDEVLILPEIELDADYIETNGVRTTYDEFLAMMDY